MNSKGKYIVLGLMILLGLAIRLFNWEKSFVWGHDADLYSWIAKDIIVNQHPRLIGQVTSVDGVFIGSLYYYLMAIGYLISGMEPWGAVIITTAISGMSMISIWWVLGKTLGNKAGWIGLGLWVFSLGISNYEKWSVPTQPVLLWTIWFWWTCINIGKNNKWGWMVYAILVGLVWQIHIGLLPLLPVPVMGWLWTHRGEWRDQIRQINKGLIVIVLGLGLAANLPFLAFEIKSNWSQSRSMILASQKDMGGPKGVEKVKKVIVASGKELQERWMTTWDNPVSQYWPIGWILALVLGRRKKPDTSQNLMLTLAVVSLLAAQFLSKRVVSEYYFTSMAVFFLVLLVRILEKFRTYPLLALIIGYGLINILAIKSEADFSDSLYYRRQVAKYIKNDMAENNYKCLGVNFITTPGNNVGFRYLLWLEGLKQVKPSGDMFPIYNIVNPAFLTKGENEAEFGRFGIIKAKAPKDYDWSNCQKKEYEPDALLGYVD